MTTTPTTANPNAAALEPIRQRFRAVETAAPSPWVRSLRQTGLDGFAALGFPTLQHEDWRYTNVAPITRLPFAPATPVAVNGAESQLIAESIFADLPGHRLVFVNGEFSPQLSRLLPLAPGVRLENLAAALTSDTGAALIQPHLGRYAAAAGNAFTALNQAFFTDGAFIHVPANLTLTDPVELIFITSGQQDGQAIQPRNLIVAGANSRLTIVESYLSTGSGSYFTNAVTEIVAGDNAHVEHVKLQDEATGSFHIAAIGGHFGRTSHTRIHSLALGARLSRNNIRVNLAGEGLESVLNGLYLTRGEQLADHHMIVEHAQPHCASHEYFNGILDDQSKGVFHGRILVREIAQKTDAKQTNKNLLLSDRATADTKPQLEIYADDVKCTHGATIGQLNPESLFYLRSRGLNTDTAKRMLVHAFAGEIIERIQEPSVRQTIDQLVWDRLEANPHLADLRHV